MKKFAVQSIATRYSAAVGIVLLTLVSRVAVTPWLEDRLPFMPFFVAIAIVVAYGGVGPSVLSSVLGFLAAEVVIVHHGHGGWFGNPVEIAVAGGYFVSAATIVVLGSAMRLSREQAVSRLRELERQVEERLAAEEALRQVRDGLEQSVRERTAEVVGAMEALEIERRRFQEVLELLPVSVAVLTPDRRISFSNRVFREWFGEPAGGRCFETMYGRTAPCEFCENFKIFQTRQPHEWECAAPNGRHYRVFALPYHDPAGAMLVLKVMIDITEAKTAATALARQAALLQLAHDAILVTGPDATIRSWNRGAEDLYGWTAAEAIGRNVTELVQATLPAPLSEMLDALQTETQWQGELVEANRAGQLIVVASRWSLQRGRDGRIEEILAINRDITERKSAMEELRRSEERYRALVSASTQLVWTAAPDGMVEEVPGGLYTTIVEEQAKGWGWLDALHADDREATAASWAEAVRTRSAYQAEFRIRRNDGEYRNFVSRGIPLLEPNGDVREWVGTCTDITEKKRAEAALARKHAELERSNSELEQFAYVASHDLQEPLRMVSNFTQLLAARYGDKLDQDARDFIGFAVEGATRMQTLIQDLLALSRVGTRGKSFERVQMKMVLERALANLQFAMRESGAQVTGEDLPELSADPSQITQLFQNLIGNSLKFRDGQPPRINISAAQAGKEWIFSVRDNGIGFEPKYAERIFAIFQRLHARDKYSGTGIGLALCRKIVERHHGRIWAESQPGCGATFRFTLPAEPVPAEQREASTGVL